VTPTRVLVTGGRHYGLEWHVRQVLDDCLARLGAIVVVHGDNRSEDGADFFARRWALDAIAAGKPVIHEPHPADWDAPCRPECNHGGRQAHGDGGRRDYCRAQGNYRNQEKLIDPGAGECHAFFQQGRLGQGGTGDCAERADNAGILVHRYEHGVLVLVQARLF
jgi:YspA, cpYpsA-related SLOG family